ncbi:MAG: hypothetical protein WBJ81_04350 [Rickettsiales bacterium]
MNNLSSPIEIESKKNKYFISWSWEAFLFSSAWLCYLKMYRYAFTLLLIELIILVLAKESFISPIIFFGSFALVPILSRIFFGLFGKSIHLNWLEKKNIPLQDMPRSLIAFTFMPLLLNAILFGGTTLLQSNGSVAEIIANKLPDKAAVSTNELGAEQCIIIGYEAPLKISQVQEIGALLKQNSNNFITFHKNCNDKTNFIEGQPVGYIKGEYYYKVWSRESDKAYAANDLQSIKMLQSLFEKSYSGDNSYKTDIEWVKLIYSQDKKSWITE